ncbi:MAG: hypothetical protein QOC98_3392 [Frankiaceae bacterium]|nr:hypothetical protein [Frankiaceae bacterium]
MPRRFALSLLALLALAGCARSREVVAPPNAEQPNDTWRSLVTEDDRTRLRHWRDAWIAALAQARPTYSTAIAGEGSLLDPDAGLPEARLPAGDYRCRAIKLGAQSANHAAYTAYEPRPCRVGAEGTRLHLTILDGPQRPIGILFPDTGRRMVFLGTLQLGDEALAYRYGRDRERDMIGLLERIGDRRWRLVLPSPHFESLLDVIELVPAR